MAKKSSSQRNNTAKVTPGAQKPDSTGKNIGKLLGSIQAPLSNTVGVMGSMVRSIVTVLDAIRKQKEEQASA